MVVIKATIDEVSKESFGYQLLKDDIIKCANCNKSLLNVIKIQNNDERHAIRVDCPYCQDESFWYRIDGKICIMPIDTLSMIDMQTKIANDVKFTKIKVVKNEK